MCARARAQTEAIDAARREFRLRALPDCFASALHNHVLPLAQRDSSQRFRARLAQDDGVQALIRDYKDQVQEVTEWMGMEPPFLLLPPLPQTQPPRLSPPNPALQTQPSKLSRPPPPSHLVSSVFH